MRWLLLFRMPYPCFIHDDVTHGKRSLLSKMPGTKWEQFAHLRLLLSYMITHPGKNSFLWGRSSDNKRNGIVIKPFHGVNLSDPYHRGIYDCVVALNHFYLSHPALYKADFSHEGFEWVEPFDKKNLVLSYLRKGGEETLLCIHHFYPVVLKDYWIPCAGNPIKIFSTDLKKYQGLGTNINMQIEQGGIRLTLPSLTTLILSL